MKSTFGTKITSIFVLTSLMVLASLIVFIMPSAVAEEKENLISATLDEQFHLKINQTAILKSENIEVKFLNVTNDSRCPSDVKCVWQGQVIVVVNIKQNDQNLGNFKLTSIGGEEKLAVKNFIGEKIKLVEVSPYPESTKTVQLSDYVVTLIVSETLDRTILIPDGSAKHGCEETKTCFFPNSIRIKPDTIITWENMDSAAHTVTSGNIIDGPDNIFSSGLISPGESFSHKFTIMKPQDYYCMIHPWMTGSVIVEFEPFDVDKKIITVEGVSLDGSVLIEVQATEPVADEQLGIHVYFRNSTQSLITGINYDLEVTQNKITVMSIKGQYSHTGIEEHWTDPLRSNSPVDVKVTILGIGLPDDESNWSGPKGEVVMFYAVPEFPFTWLILVASMGIILITRTKLNQTRKPHLLR